MKQRHKDKLPPGFIQLNAVCPHCGHTSDCASKAINVGGKVEAVVQEVTREPHPGDSTICRTCGGIGFFGKDMKLHKPTDKDWKLYPPIMRKAVERMSLIVKLQVRIDEIMEERPAS